MTNLNQFVELYKQIDFHGLTHHLFFDGHGGSLGSSRPPGSMRDISYKKSGRDSCLHLHWLNENTYDDFCGYYWEPWLNQTGFGVQAAVDLFNEDGSLAHEWLPRFMLGSHIKDGSDLHRMMRSITIGLMQEVSGINERSPEDYLGELKKIEFQRGIARSCFIGNQRTMSTTAVYTGAPIESVPPHWWDRNKWLNDNSPIVHELWQNLEEEGIRVGFDGLTIQGENKHSWEPRFITRSWLADGQRIYDAGTEALRLMMVEVDRINHEIADAESLELSDLPWLSSP